MKEILKIAHRAGKEILKIYHSSSFEVKIKKDKTPLTKADSLSHTLLTQGLKDLYPEIPIISEEGAKIRFEERKNWKRFWLVDPLDGTKEFIKRSGEFTINIALIENSLPSLGVIYLPSQEITYYAQKEKAYKIERRKKKELEMPKEKKELVAIVSRYHFSPETKILIKKLGIKNYLSAGSALKFCQMVEGKASIYPRLAPIWEWDTAAGDCISKAVGLEVMDLQGKELRYNKKELKHDGFVVCYPHLKEKIIQIYRLMNLREDQNNKAKN